MLKQVKHSSIKKDYLSVLIIKFWDANIKILER